jgi:HEAT repeat protein
MKHLPLTCTLLALGSLVLPELSHGHGGTYRGPGDTVPPGGGDGGGSGPPSSSPPGAPGPGGPSGRPTPGSGSPTPPGGAPGGAGGPSRSRGAMESGPDLSLWDFWWGFNKEPYLGLRSKIHAGATVTGSDDFFLGKNEQSQAKDMLRPTEAMIREVVVPALIRVLERETDNDMLTAAMIALAKIGDVASEDGASEFVSLLSPLLSSGSQEVSETATVALGILGDERSLPLLVALMNDEAPGRKAVGGKEVPNRTRAFAAYGLGLIGHRAPSNAVRQDIAELLVEVLERPDFAQHDIKVGALSALGIVPLDWAPSEADPAAGPCREHVNSRAALIRYLTHYMDPAHERANSRTRSWFVRTHVPMALGRLIQAEPEAETDGDRASVAAALDTLLAMAEARTTERKETVQSVVIALGMLANAGVASGKDDALGRANDAARARLLQIAANSPDNQSEYFALIALAQCGARPGAHERGVAAQGMVQDFLLTQAARAKGQKVAWASLALGVYGRGLLDNGDSVDAALVGALRSRMADEKTPQIVGAHALALGLVRDQESRALLTGRFLDGFNGSDEARGYIAVGLGLMEAREAIAPIQEVVRASKYRPDLLKQAAVALGLLGDKDAVPDLIGMLKTARGLSSQSAVASALGTIGDRRCIDPLVALLGDVEYTTSARAFAAVALGLVCDKEDLPWNTKIAVNCNYRANTSTLTGEGRGILDIL